MNRHFWRCGATWALTVLVITSAGCSMFPESWVMNAQKLNRGPGPSQDPFLSIPDHTPDYSGFEEAAETDEASMTP